MTSLGRECEHCEGLGYVRFFEPFRFPRYVSCNRCECGIVPESRITVTVRPIVQVTGPEEVEVSKEASTLAYL